MTRQNRQWIITFIDGEIIEISGNREVVNLGVLTISTQGIYGGPDTDVHHFPLNNIRVWHERDES